MNPKYGAHHGFWCKIGDKSHGRIQSGSKHHYQQTNKCKLNKKFKLMIFPTKTVVIPKISNQKCFTVLSFKFFRMTNDPPVIHCGGLQVELLVICRLPKRSMVRSEPEVAPAADQVVQVEGSIRQGIHPNLR